jgi:hypothetical protein
MATETRAGSGVERLAPLAGVAYAICVVVAMGAWSDIIEPGQVAAEKVKLYVDDPDEVLLGSQLFGLAAFLLLWFGGALRSAIRAVEGDDDRLATTAFGGSVAAAACLLVGAVTNVALALRAEDIGDLEPEVGAAVGDVASVLVAGAAPIGMAVIVGATALMALRARAILPTWLAWISVPLAIGLVIMPINWALMIVFNVWAAVVGILLYLRNR